MVFVDLHFVEKLLYRGIINGTVKLHVLIDTQLDLSARSYIFDASRKNPHTTRTYDRVQFEFYLSACLHCSVKPYDLKNLNLGRLEICGTTKNFANHHYFKIIEKDLFLTNYFTKW